MHLRVFSLATLLSLALLGLAVAADEWEEQDPTKEPKDLDDLVDGVKDLVTVIIDKGRDTDRDSDTVTVTVTDTDRDTDTDTGTEKDGVPGDVLESIVLTLKQEGEDASTGEAQNCTDVTPSLAGFQLVDVKRGQSEGSAKVIEDGTTDFVVPAEMGMDFTFTAVPESACVTAVQFLLFDYQGNFMDWDTIRDPPYLERATQGAKNQAFTAFGNSEPPAGWETMALKAPFTKAANEAIGSPGIFTLAAIPFNANIEGKDIEVQFTIPASEKAKFLSNEGSGWRM